MTLHGQLPGSDMPAHYIDEEDNPSAVSQVYANAWEDIYLVRTLLAGARALRAEKVKFLPRFELETDADYATRVAFAPLSNYFSTAHRNIASKPFTKEVKLQGEVSQNIRDFAEDVTGGGVNLHSFLRAVFFRGTAYGRHGIMIDYPTIADDATLADERASGARPYWAHVAADRLLSAELTYVNGLQRVTHARIIENSMVRQGFKETLVKRVRVLDHSEGYQPAWGLYQFNDGGPGGKASWDLIGAGIISLPFIPLVIFRPGEDENGNIVPPLIDLAHLQIEHYQQSSTLKNILQLAGFPMLTGNGVDPPVDDEGKPATMTVGPRAVLFAPANPTGAMANWSFIEPQGTSIQRLQENIERLERDMATTGLQPLLRSSGGVTATAEAITAARAQAAAESWAMDLKDVAEHALAYTSIWYDEEPTAELYIQTDFGVELKGNNDINDILLARDKNVISTDTTWDELLRRDFLGPQFDKSKEVEKVKNDPIPPPPISTLKGEGSPPGDGKRPPIGANIQANRPPSQKPSILGKNDGG